MRRAFVISSLAMLACGNGAAPPRQVPTPVLHDTPAANGADTIVATVDGHPVWASCVQAQAAAHHLAAAAALQECIDFELLAQAAITRGVDQRVALSAVQRDQMVSAFVQREFETKFQRAEDLPADIVNKVFETNRFRMHQGDYRASSFIRLGVPANEHGSPKDMAAKTQADTLYAELKDQHGLYPEHLLAAAKRVLGDKTFEFGNTEMSDEGRLVPTFATALFGLPAIGDVSTPVRTDWGWDIILFTQQLPPRELTEAQLRVEMFPALRTSYFAYWANGIAKGLGLRPSIADTATALLAPRTTEAPASK